VRPAYITESYLKTFIQQGLAEDVGSGDVSTEALGARGHEICNARLLIKDTGVLAGMELTSKIFTYVDPQVKLNFLMSDGDTIRPGGVAMTVSGPAHSLLTTERFMLNCIQRMSGIATATRHFVDLIKGTDARILDTRKTTPNFRAIEKWAVTIGGGSNHRMGLADMIMIKDNHITAAGGIVQAIALANTFRQSRQLPIKIEVEVKNLEELQQALASGAVDIIMLDNMAPAQMKEAVRIIGGRCQTEASGGITESNVREVALCGVDFVSVGAITHSARSLDLSLKIF
jgi:nicotinate-nucleotide pyrophosphorylase (carboxylating)